MKVKCSNRKPWMRIVAERMWHNRVLYTFFIFIVGAYIYSTGFIDITIELIKKNNISLIRKIIAHMQSKPEHITIDIKHKDFLKLAHKRQVALGEGILISSPEDYVPAKIRYKDRTIDVKLRLKGDLRDHWEGSKWSLRVIVKGDNTLFGMKQFSLQHPKTRGYIYEWLYHEALRREGVLSLRYKFIDTALNGKNLGIYAVEEHFEKRLIENNGLREGPIVRFQEDLLWAEELQQGFPKFRDGKQKNGSGSYLSSNIDAFHTRKLLTNPASYSQFTKAIHLLESFRRHKLKTNEVFDTHKLAKYFAITDLMGAAHGALWFNSRFYYNPITSRLEPIGFDARGGNLPLRITSLVVTNPGIYLPKNDAYYYYHYYFVTLFSDRIFYEEYIKQLERISEPSYLDKLFVELKDELEKNLNIIYREFPDFHFSKDVFYQNQQYIKTVLNPVKGLHAYYANFFKNGIELQLGNIQYLPIQILSVSYKDSVLFLPTEETILPGKHPALPIEYWDVKFTIPEGFVWSDTLVSDLKINYKMLGASRIRSETVFPWSHRDNRFVERDFIRQEPNVHKFDFLVMDESVKKIFIKPGIWNLDQSLIIPKGYQVIARGDTTLNLSNSAKILSYSPLEFIGSEEHSIIIHATDSTGQGLVVMNAHQISVLQHVIFKNLSNPSQSGWELTGAVNFYESPVDISYCQFVGNRSEDALNIVRSEFTIDKTFFSQTFSDAFDADFAKGKITYSSFAALGNDAVDVSGSVIELQDVFINGAGDKGVSVGENSQMVVNNIDIKNAEIAIASKDMSNLTIRDINISDSKIGFTTYQKKPEFGPASIKVDGLKMININVPYLIEERSSMIVDGVVVESNQKNVEEILYGVEYGKSTK